jgi:anti-anti-sigma regulatory factor
MRENASTATPVLRQHRPNVLPLEGDIDLHVSPVVTESLNAVIKKKPERIVIDLPARLISIAQGWRRLL